MVDFNLWTHMERLHSMKSAGGDDVLGDYKTA